MATGVCCEPPLGNDGGKGKSRSIGLQKFPALPTCYFIAGEGKKKKFRLRFLLHCRRKKTSSRESFTTIFKLLFFERPGRSRKGKPPDLTLTSITLISAKGEGRKWGVLMTSVHSSYLETAVHEGRKKRRTPERQVVHLSNSLFPPFTALEEGRRREGRAFLKRKRGGRKVV